MVEPIDCRPRHQRHQRPVTDKLHGSLDSGLGSSGSQNVHHRSVTVYTPRQDAIRHAAAVLRTLTSSILSSHRLHQRFNDIPQTVPSGFTISRKRLQTYQRFYTDYRKHCRPQIAVLLRRQLNSCEYSTHSLSDSKLGRRPALVSYHTCSEQQLPQLLIARPIVPSEP